MLSIERCRELLGGRPEMSDDEIKKVRDYLYGLAELVVASVECEQCGSFVTDSGFE